MLTTINFAAGFSWAAVDQFRAQGNTLDIATVENVLINLDLNGISAGILNLGNTTGYYPGSLSPAAVAAADSLFTKGWLTSSAMDFRVGL